METNTDKTIDPEKEKEEQEEKKLDQNDLEYLKRKFETFGDCA